MSECRRQAIGAASAVVVGTTLGIVVGWALWAFATAIWGAL